MIIQQKRTYTAGRAPLPSEIIEGQLFINFPDQKIYSKDNNGVIYVVASYAAGSTSNGIYQETPFTATAGQTSFNATYSVGNVQVFVNGTRLASTAFTATNGTSVTLSSAANANDAVVITSVSPATGYSEQNFTGDGTTKTFNITNPYTPGDSVVYVNGVKQPASSFTATDGKTITFATAPASGAVIAFTNLVSLPLTTWVQANQYVAGAVVFYQGTQYYAQGPVSAGTAFAIGTTSNTWNTTNPTSLTTWVQGNAYTPSQSVYYQGVLYYPQSAIAANTPWSVGTGTGQWSTTPLTTWVLGNAYVPLQSVYYNGVLYYPQGNVDSNTPFAIGTGNNKWGLNPLTTWSLPTAYNKGDSVYYNGTPYWASSNIPANTPFAIGTGTNQWSTVNPIASYVDPNIASVVFYAPLNNSLTTTYPTLGMLSEAVLPSFTGSYPLFNAQALQITGSTDTNIALSPIAFSTTSDFTVECWVNPTARYANAAANTNYPLVTSSTGNAAFLDLSLAIANITAGGYGTTSLAVTTPTGVAVNAGSVPNNAWTHVALVRKSNSCQLYVNGASVGSSFADTQALSFNKLCTDVSNKIALGLQLREVRISNIARYSGASYVVPAAPFNTYSPAVAYAAQAICILQDVLYFANAAIAANVPFATGTTGATWNTQGLTTWVQANAYAQNATVYYNGIKYYAQSSIASNTPWSVGTLPGQWATTQGIAQYVDANVTSVLLYAPLTSNWTDTYPTQNVLTVDPMGAPTFPSNSKVLFGKPSMQFGSNTGALDIPSGTCAVGSGADFTAELWVYYPSGAISYQSVFGDNATKNVITFHAGVMEFYHSADTCQTGSVTLNTWHHVALVRSSSVYTLYLDGVPSATTVTDGAAVNYTMLGRDPTTTSSDTDTAYMRELRFSNVARYTGTFVPPTQPFNTFSPSISYSTGQLAFVNSVPYFSQGIYTGSSGTPGPAFTLGSVGGTFNTTKPTYFYSLPTPALLTTVPETGAALAAGYVSITALATDSPYQDSISAWTPVDFAPLKSKFGSGSLVFSATRIAPNAEMQLPMDSPFTMEAFVYPTANVANACIFGANVPGGLNLGGGIYLYQGNFCYYPATSGSSFYANNPISLNTWHHVAVVYDGSNIETYVDGKPSGSPYAVTRSSVAGFKYIYIGGDAANQDFAGFMECIRWTASVQYTTAFTPPTAPFDTWNIAASYALNQATWLGGKLYCANGAIAANTPFSVGTTGATFSQGLTTWLLASAYNLGQSVVYRGKTYFAQGAVAANTPFAVGTTAATWGLAYPSVVPAIQIVPSLSGTILPATFTTDLPQDGVYTVGTSKVALSNNTLFSNPSLDFSTAGAVLQMSSITLAGGGVDTNLIDATKLFTVEAWINPSTIAGTNPYAIVSGANANNCGGLYILNQNLCVSNAGVYTCVNPVTSGSWLHVALVYDGVNVETYVNGKPSGSPVVFNWASTGGSTSGDKFQLIGQDTVGHQFAGQMANIRMTQAPLYNTAFTPATTPFDSWFLASAYLANDSVWHQGVQYFAQSAIAANTPFVIGTGINQWSTTQALPDLSAKTKLLMHMDGTQGSAIFIDAYGNTIKSLGSPIISTASVKMGTGALYLNGSSYLSVTSFPILFNNTTSGVVGGYPATDWNTSWTIECWLNTTSSANMVLIDNYQASGVQLYLSAGKLTPYYNATLMAAHPAIINDGSWHHVALCSDGTTVRAFVDGVLGSSVAVAPVSSAVPAHLYPVTIGGQDNGSSESYPYLGFIDEVRILRGAAAYVANFTPPNVPFVVGTNWSPYLAYTSGDPVTYSGVVYYAQSNIAASVGGTNTFVIGTGANQFSIDRLTSSVYYTLPTAPATATPTYLNVGSGGTGNYNTPVFTDIPVDHVSAPGPGTVDVNCASPTSLLLDFTNTKFGGGSYLFDNSTHTITSTPNSVALILTNPFCVEFYVYYSSSQTQAMVLAAPDSGNGCLIIQNGFIGCDPTSSNTSNISTNGIKVALPAASWHHVALCGSGTTIDLYVDGVSSKNPVAVGTPSTLSTFGTTFVGNVEMLRFSQSQVYTGDFTPPAVPFDTWTVAATYAINDTVWYQGVKYQANAPIPANTAFVIGTTGATWSALSKYGKPPVIYVLPSYPPNLPSGGLLLTELPYDYSYPIDASNPIKSTAITKFGGGSLYFPTGTGLSVNNGTGSIPVNLSTTSASWSVEMWVYPNNCSGANGNYVLFSSSTSIGMMINSYNGAISLKSITTNPTTLTLDTYAATFTDNAWSYVSFNCDGTNINVYVNGVHTGTGNVHVTGVANLVAIGATQSIGSGSSGGFTDSCNCYLEDIRVFNYVKRTSSFTGDNAVGDSWVQSQAYVMNDLVYHNNGKAYYAQGTVAANTPFAIGTGNNTFNTDPVPVQDPNIATTVFWLTGTLARNTLGATANQEFVTAIPANTYVTAMTSSSTLTLVPGSSSVTGTGSLTIHAGNYTFSKAYTLGGSSADYTIEFFINIATTTGDFDILPNGNNYGLSFSGGKLVVSGLYTSPTLTLGVWHHFAMVRKANVLTWYLDGVGTQVSSNDIDVWSIVGLGSIVMQTSDLVYIDSLRASASANYTANFTPSKIVTTWNLATAYLKGQFVLANSLVYYAQDDIPANTPWVIGTSGSTWNKTMPNTGDTLGNMVVYTSPKTQPTASTFAYDYPASTVSTGSNQVAWPYWAFELPQGNNVWLWGMKSNLIHGAALPLPSNVLSGDFTVEFRVAFLGFPGNQNQSTPATIWAQASPLIQNLVVPMNNELVVVASDQSNKNQGYIGFYQASIAQTSGAQLVSPLLTYRIWYHIALVRSNGNIMLYIDGVPVSNTPLAIADPINYGSLGPATSGGYPGATSTWDVFGGYEGVRISNVARYTKAFQPVSVDTTQLVTTWDKTLSYVAGNNVYYYGSLYYAQGAVPANTSFAIGTTGATWNSTPVSAPTPGPADTFLDHVQMYLPLRSDFTTGIGKLDSPPTFNVGSATTGWNSETYAVFNGSSIQAYNGSSGYTNVTDYTWECFIKTEEVMDLVNAQTIFSNGGVNSLLTGYKVTNQVAIQGLHIVAIYGGNASPVVHPTVLAANTWYHVALVRATGIMTLYVGGVPCQVFNGVAPNLILGQGDSDADFYIGNNVNSTAPLTSTNGMRELRLTSAARYTGTFAPPTAPFDTWLPNTNYPLNSNVIVDSIRYYSQASLNNQPFTISATTWLTTSLTTVDPTKAYNINDTAVISGTPVYAQSAIAANTAISLGFGSNQWLTTPADPYPSSVIAQVTPYGNYTVASGSTSGLEVSVNAKGMFNVDTVGPLLLVDDLTAERPDVVLTTAPITNTSVQIVPSSSYGAFSLLGGNAMRFKAGNTGFVITTATNVTGSFTVEAQVALNSVDSPAQATYPGGVYTPAAAFKFAIFTNVNNAAGCVYLQYDGTGLPYFYVTDDVGGQQCKISIPWVAVEPLGLTMPTVTELALVRDSTSGTLTLFALVNAIGNSTSASNNLVTKSWTMSTPFAALAVNYSTVGYNPSVTNSAFLGTISNYRYSNVARYNSAATYLGNSSLCMHVKPTVDTNVTSIIAYMPLSNNDTSMYSPVGTATLTSWVTNTISYTGSSDLSVGPLVSVNVATFSNQPLDKFSTPAQYGGVSAVDILPFGGYFENYIEGSSDQWQSYGAVWNPAQGMNGSNTYDPTKIYAQSYANVNIPCGAGDFQVEMWICPSSQTIASPGYNVLMASADTQFTPTLYQGKAGIYTNSSFQCSSSTALVANVWYHYAVVRRAGVITVYVNGVANPATVSSSTNSVTFIYLLRDTPNYNFGGYVRELKVQSVVTYTANFIPPVLPFRIS